MKKNEALQKDVPDEIKWEPLSGVSEIGVVAKVSKHLKKFIFIASLAGVGLCFNACTTTGYVASEPTYLESARPQQPSTLHIWVDGDWVYNRQSRNYVHNDGYWEVPNQDRRYVTGHWQSSPRGYYWVRGHWQRQNR